LRVLYIDDDDQYAHLFKVSVARLGHRVVTYGNPSAALESLVAANSPYELLVTDFRMPGMDGLELVRRARLSVAGQRCAVISSDLAAVGEERAAQAGACWTQRKPERVEEFRDLLARAMASANPA
jgi:DNA-binding NtrC family response regulator